MTQYNFDLNKLHHDPDNDDAVETAVKIMKYNIMVLQSKIKSLVHAIEIITDRTLEEK